MQLLDPIDDSAWDTPETTYNDYLAYGMLDILGNVRTLFPVLRHYEDSALPGNYEFLTSKCLLEKPIAMKETIDSFQKNAVPRTLLISDPTVNLQALEAMKADADLGGVFQAPIIEPRVVVEPGWKRILDDALVIFPDIMSSHGRQKTVTTRRCPIELNYDPYGLPSYCDHDMQHVFYEREEEEYREWRVYEADATQAIDYPDFSDEEEVMNDLQDQK